MNTLREAVQDYLAVRRDLGFKLREAGKGLFVVCRDEWASRLMLNRTRDSFLTSSRAHGSPCSG
jgi:hypothetical protein